MAERSPKRKRTGSADDSNAPDNTTQMSPDIDPGLKSPTVHDLPAICINFTKADLVTLLVGHVEHELVTHGHRLAASSEFFRTALKRDWKEGQTRVVRLPEDDIGTVRYYLDFVLSGMLISHKVKCASDMWQKDNLVVVHRLCVLYVFGERVLDSVLRNAIVKELLRLALLPEDNCTAWVPGWGSGKVIYGGTPAGSPMRRFMVDLLIARSAALKFEGQDISGCSQLLLDMTTRYANMAACGENPQRGWRERLQGRDYSV